MSSLSTPRAFFVLPVDPTGFFYVLPVDSAMDIGLVGDGPAVDAIKTALGDVDVNVMPVEP